MGGNLPTFAEIGANNESWNISKFMKFCGDFELIGRKKGCKFLK